MKILLLGSTGMLGSECKAALSKDHEVIAPDRKELDIVRWDVVIQALDEISPDVVLNCAASSSAHADNPQQPGDLRIDVEGPRNLAQGCSRFNARMIHISSSLVFNGQKVIPQPYFEDDDPRPLSSYGKTKLESEIAVQENSPQYVIVRTGWLYSNGYMDFVDTILSQVLGNTEIPKFAYDEAGSPTWTYRLALQIKKLIGHGAQGIYHATAEGYCSKYECAKYIVDTLGMEASIGRCGIKELPGGEITPPNSVLENRRLKKQGIHVMRGWKEDLSAFLESYGSRLIQNRETKKARVSK